MRDTLTLALVRAELCRAEMGRRRYVPPCRHVGLCAITGRKIGALLRTRHILFVIQRGTRRRHVIAHETLSPPD